MQVHVLELFLVEGLLHCVHALMDQHAQETVQSVHRVASVHVITTHAIQPETILIVVHYQTQAHQHVQTH